MLTGNKTKLSIFFFCALLLLLISLKFAWIYGLVLILFLPGFALTILLLRDMAIPIDERIGVSVILSISVNVLTIFVMNYFLGVEITAHNIAGAMLLVSLLFFLLFLVYLYFEPPELLKIENSIKNSIKNFNVTRGDLLKLLLLISALILVFNLVYAVHWDYPYPYHVDEWINIEESVAIMENHALLKEAPNCKGIKKSMDLEIGAHIFLAELFLLTGADPVTSYKYLPALFAAISAFLLFLIIKRHNFYAAILAMLFFASLKTNVSILGLWIFAPLTMSIAMIYGITLMFLKALENKLSFFFSASISLLALALIHPISAVFVYMFIFLYIILKFIHHLLCLRGRMSLNAGESDAIFTKKNIAGFGILFLIPSVSFIYFLAILSKGSASQTINWFITKFIIFPKVTYISSLIYQPNYIPDIYGILGIGLAVIGSLYVFYMRKKSAQLSRSAFSRGLSSCGSETIEGLVRTIYQWKYPDLLVVAALTGVINLILFHFPRIGASLLNGAAYIFKIFGINLVFNFPEYFTLFIFYERFIYYTMIFMAPLSAVGLYAVARSIANSRILMRIHKYMGIFLCLLLVIALLTMVFGGYYENKGKLYKLITDEDYEAIKWVEENKGMGHVILARQRVSMAIYPVSRNYIVSGTVTEGNCPRENINDTIRFFGENCSEMLKILETHNVDYLISDSEILCSNLKEIYRNEKDHVYKVRIL